MNSAKLVRRNSYDDLTPLYTPNQLQTKQDNLVHNNNINNNNRNFVNKPDQNLYDDLYDFNDIPLDDGLIIQPNGIRSNGIGGLDDTDTDEGKLL
jgi:hypothetical protein